MANFGGPDAQSAGMLAQILQNKQKMRMDALSSIGDSIFTGIKLGQNAEELELKKEDQALDREKFDVDKGLQPKRLALADKELERAIIELNIKSMEQENMLSARTAIAALAGHATGTPGAGPVVVAASVWVPPTGGDGGQAAAAPAPHPVAALAAAQRKLAVALADTSNTPESQAALLNADADYKQIYVKNQSMFDSVQDMLTTHGRTANAGNVGALRSILPAGMREAFAAAGLPIGRLDAVIDRSSVAHVQATTGLSSANASNVAWARDPSKLSEHQAEPERYAAGMFLAEQVRR